MGAGQAQEFASLVSEGLNLEIALLYHFQSNHFPPLPIACIPVAVKAIEAINEDDPGRLLELPGGITWKGQTSAPASACAESWHLEYFILGADDYYQED